MNSVRLSYFDKIKLILVKGLLLILYYTTTILIFSFQNKRKMVPSENDDLERKVKEIITHELDKANFSDLCKRYMHFI